MAMYLIVGLQGMFPVGANSDYRAFIVRPANRDWACQTERCQTLSNKTSLQ